MVVSDPIADLLTRMRNAILAGKKDVKVPSSKMKKEVIKVLKNEGYISEFQEAKEAGRDFISLNLKGEKPLTTLERVSKPGRRVYAKKDEIPVVLSGYGLVILSTSKGIMTGKEANVKGLGGELICKIY